MSNLLTSMIFHQFSDQVVCTIKTEVEPIAAVYIPKESKQLVLASHGRVEIFNSTTGKSLKKYCLRVSYLFVCLYL